MNRALTCIFIASAALVSFAAQQAVPNVSQSSETALRGRIVLYDWASHETTSGDDFIVKTMDSPTPYARVIYKPLWGFDAPPASSKAVLDRWAFVGRGTAWNF